MRIDAHQHFWIFDPPEYPWMDADMQVLRRDWLPDDLRPLLEARGIDACIAVQARVRETETDFLLMLATQYAWIGAVIGWVDLRAGDLEQRLARWSDAPKLRGFRHPLQDEPDVAAFVNDPGFRHGVRLLQRQERIYEVLVFAHQLDAVRTFCGDCDGHWLVLDHLGKPAIRKRDHATWRRSLEPIAAMPHVMCKVSGLVTEAIDATGQFDAMELRPYLDSALELFGPQRLMFGSDWPVCLLATPYARVASIVESWAAQLSVDEREALWGGNAQRTYRVAARKSE
ncbi:MAG TPA: amidohydrolase family protein [Povalibacter sp.]|jgi:L-fuconolactonase|nr:amidohydrolase family protein [Povalibacter sp.]